jgi:hypothetical protein
MTEKSKTILNYFVLLLLAAAIIAFGRYINSKNVSPEKDYAQKLAELRADLTKSAAAGPGQQQKSGGSNRKPAGKSPKAGST